MNRVLSSLTFITLLLITWPAWVNAQEIRIDNDDLGGVVTSNVSWCFPRPEPTSDFTFK